MFANPQMLAAVLHHAGAPPADQDNDGPATPLAAVQDCIQDVHELLRTLPDPAHTMQANQALGLLLKIQTDLMQPKGAQSGGR